MRVFVTGGTGAIGGHAVPALLREGHTVTALARTPEKAATLAGQGATPAMVALFDREALASAFAGHDAVVNLATAIPPMSRPALPQRPRGLDRDRRGAHILSPAPSRSAASLAARQHEECAYGLTPPA
ncbi:SDR family oxidoreductase [Nonomuraea sp. M3C6]|uniref:SDR family oxidoreductase n=1 Tax=Nonomuraea marmarensis TaxID=3351344 RepID=A0ABW7AVE2_9ACTN